MVEKLIAKNLTHADIGNLIIHLQNIVYQKLPKPTPKRHPEDMYKKGK